MLPITVLPKLNAVLNSLSAIFLVMGYVFIRRKNMPAHKACMLTAFATSTLFLISYLTYHYNTGIRRFAGQGTVRDVYLTILLTHTVLAAVIVPLVLITLRRAFKAAFARHVKIARWTLPIWMYVSVTGVVVYWMLYRM
jgi:putative membrane protein